jgi:hypothetical protein
MTLTVRAASSRSFARSAGGLGTAKANGAITSRVATEPTSKIGESTAAPTGKSRYVPIASATSSPMRFPWKAMREARVIGAGAEPPPFPRSGTTRVAIGYGAPPSRAYAFTISRTSRWRITSASVK